MKSEEVTRDVTRRLKLENHFFRKQRKELLQQRSRLGKFKDKLRSAEDRTERNRLEAEIRELERRIKTNSILLPPHKKTRSASRSTRG